MQTSSPTKSRRNAVPRTGQHAEEIPAFGTVVAMPLGLGERDARESVDNLNQILADTITLRDLYKKHHWQVSGPTFYQLHLLFDKHFGEQSELVDQIAERIMMLGGVSVAMAADIAKKRPRSPGRPRVAKRCPCKIQRLLDTRNLAGRSPQDGRPCGRRRRRRHERPVGEQPDPHQRVAGLVHFPASGGHPLGECQRAGCRRRLRSCESVAVKVHVQFQFPACPHDCQAQGAARRPDWRAGGGGRRCRSGVVRPRPGSGRRA